jgi:hypothetical protein
MSLEKASETKTFEISGKELLEAILEKHPNAEVEEAVLNGWHVNVYQVSALDFTAPKSIVENGVKYAVSLHDCSDRKKAEHRTAEEQPTQ